MKFKNWDTIFFSRRTVLFLLIVFILTHNLTWAFGRLHMDNGFVLQDHNMYSILPQNQYLWWYYLDILGIYKCFDDFAFFVWNAVWGCIHRNMDLPIWVPPLFQGHRYFWDNISLDFPILIGRHHHEYFHCTIQYNPPLTIP